MPIVKASNWSITLLLSISPASKVTFGFVVVLPGFNTAEPCALRKPLAVANTVYVPAGAVRLNVPSKLAVTEVISVFPASNKLTVTGLEAITCPFNVPFGRGVGDAMGVGDSIGVDVNVDVGDSTGVKVNVGVGDSTGVNVNVGVGDSTGPDVCVAVAVGVSPGAEVCVAVAVSPGAEVSVAVGDSTGEGVKVGVAPFPLMVRLAEVEGRVVRTLFPCETRAIHSIADCPACNPLTLKLKAAPLVVALLPLLPAIATMKLPFCGVVNAAAGSGPKRFVTTMLFTSTRLALYVQVNSALVYPSGGTLFKFTVTVAVSPTFRLVGLTTVEAEGWVLATSRSVRK